MRITFIASVFKEEENLYEILLGGYNFKCVIIHVYPDDKYCSLTDLHHNKECNLTLNLLNKSGTIDMIVAGIHLCKFLFPHLEYMSLQDESVIKCGEGQHLPLGDVYMLLYGQSWYQRYLNALPEKNTSRLVTVLKSKPTMKWKVLWTDYLARGFSAEHEQKLHQIYDKSISWHTFFQQIRGDNCRTWKDWISVFVKKMSGGFTITGTIWRIDMTKTKVTSSIKKVNKPIQSIQRPTKPAPRLYFGGQHVVSYSS